MKKFSISILLLICILCFVGCNSNNGKEQNTNTPSTKVSVMEKHVVNITKENYQKFITIEKLSVVGSNYSTSYHYFRGALSYAYYDNVIVTYNYISNSTITEKTLYLNAGGCGTITTSSSRYGSSSYEIVNVTGTITYWI